MGFKPVKESLCGFAGIRLQHAKDPVEILIHLQHMLQMTDGRHAHPPQVACLTTEFIVGTAHADLLTTVLDRILLFQGRYPIAQKTGTAETDNGNRDLQITAHGPERLILPGKVDFLLPQFPYQILCGDMPWLTPACIAIPELFRTTALAGL